MRVAMVCLGNICRSPMAAAVAAALVEEAGLDDVEVESFGTAGYHEGERADPRADAALARAGWPVRRHRARRLTAGDLASAGLVLCADRTNLAGVLRLAAQAPRRGAGGPLPEIRLLRSFDPASSPGDDEVPDPWAGDDEDFDRTLDVIERACRGLLAELAAARR